MALLDLHGLVPSWFDLSVHFLGSVVSSFDRSSHESVCGSSDICQSLGFGVICNDLVNIGATCLFVYTDRSLSNLGTIDILAGAAVFFEDINSGLGVGISGLVSSTLVELQAIALALECVLSFHLVDLFSDSQTALDACRSESFLVGPDFKNHCWIECYHIVNIKGHSDISDNEHANALARDAAFSVWHLSYLVNEKFIKTGVDAVSGNSKHFVCDVFRSIYCARWEVGSSSQVVSANLHANIDWLRSFLVWHPDSHLALGFTSAQTAGFQMYFIKAFHCRLPVAVQKHLYDRSYPSVVCLFCGDIEVSNHIFSCPFEAAGRAQLLDDHVLAWKACSGLVRSFLCVSQLLSTCVANAAVDTALCKGFVFSGWFHESVSVFRDSKVATSVIVDFVCAFCLFFRDDIWLVCAKHRTFMEKNGLISHDGSILVSVFGSTLLFSPSVVRLLGIVETFGIGFRFCNIDNVVSIHIGA
ncbi:hypothetical protein G9A89_018317 [Geosiphon pyriformis]|nr:hypothetical protein G9A89_018317 [Geosiphon pyriformis]